MISYCFLCSMVIDPSANVDTITQVVQTHVSDAMLDRSHGKELTYTLPVVAVGNFAGRYGPWYCLPKVHGTVYMRSKVLFT